MISEVAAATLERIPLTYERSHDVLMKIAEGLVRYTSTKLLVEGMNNIPEERNIIACFGPHTAYPDGLSAGWMLKKILPEENVSVILNDDLPRHSGPFEPFVRKFYAVSKMLPVNTNSSEGRLAQVKLMYEHARQLNHSGVNSTLYLFPEGTRTPGYDLKEFFSGTIRLAQLANAQVLPVSMYGNEEQMPIGSKLPRRKVGPLVFSIQPPIDIPNKTNKSIDQELLDRIRTSMVSGIEKARKLHTISK